ncbi:MAG: hypothetical protein K2Y10_08385 [Burkholderiaceae bacterium]|nr:hypothetical protein [Burkholderiaceae bacterium]
MPQKDLNHDTVSRVISGLLLPSKFVYSPPYGSEIEDIFANRLEKYIDPKISVIPQFGIKTPIQTFFLDFVIKVKGVTVGIECDGRDFHKDRAADDARDTIILGTGLVDCIFRFEGKLIYHQTEDCFYILKHYFPDVFSHRGRVNINTLASDYLKANEGGFDEIIYIDNPGVKRVRDVCDKKYGNYVYHYERVSDEDESYLREERYVRINVRYESLGNHRYYYTAFLDFLEVFLMEFRGDFNGFVIKMRDRVAMIDSHRSGKQKLSNQDMKNYNLMFEQNLVSFQSSCSMVVEF